MILIANNNNIEIGINSTSPVEKELTPEQKALREALARGSSSGLGQALTKAEQCTKNPDSKKKNELPFKFQGKWPAKDLTNQGR